jgi:alkylhydroperoxidase family enzyme
VDAVVADLASSPLSVAEKVLFEFLRKANRASHTISQADVDLVKGHGWNDEALYDAITVCALFNFYNRWCDATGVHAMPIEAHEMSGKRLAEHGYVMEAPK